MSYQNNNSYLRNRKFGITITNSVISILENGGMLTSQHMCFFQNLFKLIENTKIYSANCYFFADYIPSLTIQLPKNCLNENMIKQFQGNKTNQIKVKIPIQNSEIQSELKQEHFFTIQDIKIIQNQEVDSLYQMHILKEFFKQLEIFKQENLFTNPLYIYDFIFFPINLHNNHWISVIISFKESKILFQDSLGGYSDTIIEGIFKLLSYQEDSFSKDKWQIIRDTPLQHGTLDCGVFVLYSLFYLYKNQQLINKSSFNQARISKFRQNMVTLTKFVYTQEKTTEKDIVEILEKF